MLSLLIAMRLSKFALCMSLLCGAVATNPTSPHPSSECVEGINLALGFVIFYTPPLKEGEEPSYGAFCSNTLYIDSLWAAAKSYCDEGGIAEGETYLQGQCEYYGLDFPTYKSISANLTDSFIAGLPIVAYSDIAKAETYNTSVLLEEAFAKDGIRTLTVFDVFIFDYYLYGYIIMGFWGLILTAGIANRLLHFIVDSRQGREAEETNAVTPGRSLLSSGPFHWVRTHFTIPATFGIYHSRLWWGCTLPTRLELLVLVVYYLLIIAFCSVTYEIFDPNLYYSHELQIWRYFSDRTGYLTYPNLIFLWLFSGRNNIFIWATGWNFSTFNLFHRHVARVTTMLAIAHSIGYTIFTTRDGGDLAAAYKEHYWVMGAVAIVSMSMLLFPFSSILLRRWSYEVFLISHILLSLATLVALFYHTRFYNTRIWDVYLWPVVAIWCFERFMRIVRWVYCNYHASISKGLLTTKATATYSQASDIITLNITPGANHLKPSPNQHYFVYQYNVWRGWENHPFSLASWKTESTTSDYGLGTVSVGTGTKTESEISDPPSPAVESLSSLECPQQFTFYIRPSTGFTGRLRKQCLNHSGPVPLKMLFEGPYGHSFPAHTYDTLVLIAGGSGIAGVLPFLRTYRKDSRTSRIRLIWTTKQTAMITEITRRELASDLANADLERSFFVTGKNEGLETKNNELDIHYGRPNMKILVSQEVRESGQRRTAVISCGPPGMADEARDCVHSLLKEGFRGLAYSEESFGW